MPTYADASIYSGIYFTTLVMAGQLVIMVYALLKKVDKPISPQSFFSYVTILFCIFRIANLATENQGGQVPFFTNRVAILLFLTALSITLYTWMAALGIVLAADSGLVSGVRAILEKLQWIFLFGNIVFWILQGITLAVYMTSTKQQIQGNPWYDASVLLFAGVMWLMGTLFVIQAFRLWQSSDRCSPSVQSVLLRAAICSLVVAVFFLLRIIFLLYRPISGKFMNNDGFLVGAYLLPELVPLFLSVLVHAFRVTNTKLSFRWGGHGDPKPRRSGISREDAEAAGWTPRTPRPGEPVNANGRARLAAGGGTGGGERSGGAPAGDNGFAPPANGDLEGGAGEPDGGITGVASGVTGTGTAAAGDGNATSESSTEPLISSTR